MGSPSQNVQGAGEAVQRCSTMLAISQVLYMRHQNNGQQC